MNLQTKRVKNIIFCHYFCSSVLSSISHPLRNLRLSFQVASRILNYLLPFVITMFCGRLGNSVLAGYGMASAVSLCFAVLIVSLECLFCGKTETWVYEMQMLVQYCESSAIRGSMYHKPSVLKLMYWSSSEHGWEVADACYSDLSDDKHNNCSYRWRSWTGGWHPYLSGMKICMDMQWGPTTSWDLEFIKFNLKWIRKKLNKALDPAGSPAVKHKIHNILLKFWIWCLMGLFRNAVKI